MYITIRRTVLLIILLVLVGCVSSTKNVDKDFALAPDADSGLLVGSIKYVGTMSGYKIFYKGLDNDKSGYFEFGKGMALIPIPPKSDYSNVKGKLQVAELPPGNYVIGHWGVSSGPASIKQTEKFKINFRIEPGKATYMGSFHFTVTSRMG